jgi:hypothetical protein
MGYGCGMSAEAVEPTPARSFKEASPGEIRAALIPEEQVQFDITWHTAMATAQETLDLSKVFEALESWRVHAALTDQLGHHGYREWLTRAERIARTGELPPGTVPWSQLKVELGL